MLWRTYHVMTNGLDNCNNEEFYNYFCQLVEREDGCNSAHYIFYKMEYKYKQGEDGFLYLDDEIIFEWDREQISKRSDGYWYKVGEHKYQFCGFIPATYHN